MRNDGERAGGEREGAGDGRETRVRDAAGDVEGDGRRDQGEKGQVGVCENSSSLVFDVWPRRLKLEP